MPEPDWRSLMKLFMAANADILNVDTFAWEYYRTFEVGENGSSTCRSLGTDLGSEFSREFHRQALAREILLRPIGNTVYFMPPYVIEDEEWDLLIERSIQCLDIVA